MTFSDEANELLIKSLLLTKLPCLFCSSGFMLIKATAEALSLFDLFRMENWFGLTAPSQSSLSLDLPRFLKCPDERLPVF